MKKKILLRAIGGDKWIGGLYYCKNIAFIISSNKYINSNYDLLIATNSNNYSIFSDLPENIKIIQLDDSILKNSKKLLSYANSIDVDIIYPFSYSKTYGKIKCIPWIPDFQHKFYKKYFSILNIIYRDLKFFQISKSNIPLVLSSETCQNHYNLFYPKHKNKSYVVPFISYIINELKEIDSNEEKNILKKYGLINKNYIYIGNQFWKHKNHIVVLKAIEILQKSRELNNYFFVFTGKLEDYRDKKYSKAILNMFANSNISKNSLLLGHVARKEQLCLMKNAQFFIQPSLFEGWGTILEDAKVLDKIVLLSNIPVHQEQKNKKSIIFDPYSPDDLANKIRTEMTKRHESDYKKTKEYMLKNAINYSKGFEDLLKGL